jgi:hypothetical protein
MSSPQTVPEDAELRQQIIKLLEFHMTVHVDAAMPGQHYHGVNTPAATEQLMQLIDRHTHRREAELLMIVYRRIEHIKTSQKQPIDPRIEILQNDVLDMAACKQEIPE